MSAGVGGSLAAVASGAGKRYEDMKQFKIYPSGDRTFYVWANMFQTCIRSHEGKRR